MKEQPHICPLCGRAYNEPPALSRADNQTDICPRCGMMEAAGRPCRGGKRHRNGRGGPCTPRATAGRLRTLKRPTTKPKRPEGRHRELPHPV